MMVVLFVVWWVVFLLNIMYVSKILRLGFGLVLIKKKIDWFVLLVCWMFSGEKILWLIVLLRNKILVGLIKMDVRGSRWVVMRKLILVVNVFDSIFINGLIRKKVMMVYSILIMLVEKLLINILKLLCILLLIFLLNVLIV